ncbi:class I SAM-dependent methyltransferase [Sinorhizobium fredii]|uniref:class I SAM-dependent methyltransferase n=1 Tax=Rhizobium fredii TaxID=380 RepID=UPI003511DECC
MIKNKLLSNIYFGSELEKLAAGTVSTEAVMKAASQEFAALEGKLWNTVREIVKGFFAKPLRGVFGGPITAGDAFFIAAYMASVRPATMIEVGVCSGVSSAFILYAAHKLGLTREGKIFLHSVDLLRLHGEEKHEVGRVVERNYPSLAAFWKLHVEVTAPKIALEKLDLRNQIASDEPTLAFIDANHMHPWPLVDTVSIAELLPKDSWILLQDTQVMERWIANCVERGVASPKPCRGVNLVTTLWPGDKVIGWDMCYNMGAVRLSVAKDKMRDFVEQAMRYPAETGRGQWQECVDYLTDLKLLQSESTAVA